MTGFGELFKAAANGFAVVVVEESGESIEMNESGLLHDRGLLMSAFGRPFCFGEHLKKMPRADAAIRGGLAHLVDGRPDDGPLKVGPT